MADAPTPALAAENATKITRAAWKALADIAVVPLADFLAEAARHALSPAEKERIIDQAILMIENLYPHLPYKLEAFGVSPANFLNHYTRPILQTIGEQAFHAQVMD